MPNKVKRPTLGAIIKGLTEAGTPGDLELAVLFRKHRQDINDHFRNTLMYVSDWRDWADSQIEVFGPQFHKGFRQWDVTTSGDDDVAIWKALSGGDNNFWAVLDKVMPAKKRAKKENNGKDAS